MNSLMAMMTDQSLSKKSLIKKNTQFNQLCKKGKSISSKYFQAFFLDGVDQQVGFTVQKGYKNKIQRNRLKRVTRELWRTCLDQPTRCQIVFLTRLEAHSRVFAELEDDFHDLLCRIKKDLHN